MNSTSKPNPFRLHKNNMLIVNLVQATLITITNSVLLIVYTKLGPLKRKNGNYLILTQAFADLYIGLLLWFEIIAEHWVGFEYRNLVLVLYSGMLEYSFTVCVGTLLVNAGERYILVTRPIYHKHHVTVKRLQYAWGILWVSSLVPALCLVGLMQFDITHANSGRVIRYSYVFDVIMIALISVIALIHWQSIKITKKLTYAQNNYDGNEKEIEVRPSTRNNLQKDTRLIKLFIVTMVIFVLTYIPIFMGRLLYDLGALKDMSMIDHVMFISICHVLYKVSALFNPILGIYAKRDYRNKLFVCCSQIEMKEDEDEEEEEMLSENVTVASGSGLIFSRQKVDFSRQTMGVD